LRQERYAEAESQTRAGYNILAAQMDPKVSWLKSACQDLMEYYSALKQADQAAKFLAEIVVLEPKPVEVSDKK